MFIATQKVQMHFKDSLIKFENLSNLGDREDGFQTIWLQSKRTKVISNILSRAEAERPPDNVHDGLVAKLRA